MTNCLKFLRFRPGRRFANPAPAPFIVWAGFDFCFRVCYNTGMKTVIEWFRALPWIRRYPIVKQAIKFGLVGVVITIVDFAFYLALTRSFSFWATHYLWANFIAFSVAATGSYALNRIWTFRNNHHRITVQYTKFFFVACIGLLINEIVLFVSVHQFHLFDLAGKGLAVGFTMFWNFGMNKFWTFRHGSQVIFPRSPSSESGISRLGSSS